MYVVNYLKDLTNLLLTIILAAPNHTIKVSPNLGSWKLMIWIGAHNLQYLIAHLNHLSFQIENLNASFTISLRSNNSNFDPVHNPQQK
jgi:hypothetical protein